MRQLNYSRQRDALLANIGGRYDHPTADTLYQDLRKDDPHISLGTVYRNLSLLTDLGQINRIPGSDGNDHYDGQLNPHDHFICKHCGKIIDLPSAAFPLGETSEDISRVDNMVLYGLCKDCFEKISK